jgi:hypothetical protein
MHYPAAAHALQHAFVSLQGTWPALPACLTDKSTTLRLVAALQGGGAETTALTFYTQLAHHGMLIVPIGEGPTLVYGFPCALALQSASKCVAQSCGLSRLLTSFPTCTSGCSLHAT